MNLISLKRVLRRNIIRNDFMGLTKEARRIEVAKKIVHNIVFGGKGPSSFTKKEVLKIKNAHSKKGLEAAINATLIAQEKRAKALVHARASLQKTNKILRTRGLTTKVVRRGRK